MLFENTVLTESTESKEPAFLRKLRSEHGSGDSSRHERPLARPRKHTTADDRDDDPVFVDGDSHNTISKTEFDALRIHTEPKETNKNGALSLPVTSASPPEQENTTNPDQLDHKIPLKQLEASIGRSSKKRLAKVIYDDGESAETPSNDVGNISDSRKKAKKARNIKLSFQEEGST